MENYTSSENPPVGMTRVGRLQEIFGDHVTLIPVAFGEKRAIQKEFQKLNVTAMRDPAHLDLLEKSNIAVLVGSPSANLISIDFDDEEAERQFREANPELACTVLSRGGRGGNYWFFISGEYVEKIVKLRRNGEEIGEWRGGSGYTIVDGFHPSGVPYRISSNNGVKIIQISEIKWPEGWKIGVLGEQGKALEELDGDFGPPLHRGKNGGVVLNEGFVVGWIQKENDLLYDLDFGSLFTYSEVEGTWAELAVKEVEQLVAVYLNRLAQEFEEAVRFKINQRLITSIRQQVEAALASRFRQLRPRCQYRYSAAKNGIVPVVPPSLLPGTIGHHRSFYLTQKSEISYDPTKSCPRFLNELLAPVLDGDDISLLQRAAGLILVGPNDLQKIILLEGNGLTGKSVYQLILDALLGPGAVTQLRTENLNSRFEFSRFVGKRLVAGRDVPPDFLRQKGASLLKALTGGDLLNTEKKNSNEDVPLKGDLHAIVTSNGPLRVVVESDGSAWERRLLIFPFRREGELPKRILKMDELLLAEEGEGILTWHLEGAVRALMEIEDHGDLMMTEAQKARVVMRVKESDSVAFFVEKSLESGGAGLSTEQLGASYRECCNLHGLPMETDMAFSKKLKSELERRFQAQPTENFVTEAGGRRRGYYGVRFKVVDHTSNTAPGGCLS